MSSLKGMSLSVIGNLLKSREVSRIVLMAGAGISTPSGIPDFRTPGSGLYDNLEKYNLPYQEAVFDINYFATNPKPFFDVAKKLYPGRFPPNVCHWFARILQDKDLLLRFYTQNIDGMENLAGISSDKLIEAHGSFASATCQGCYAKYEASHLKSAIFNDEVPKCKKCQHVVKPDIVFFGEQLPHTFMKHLVDMPCSDLLIVMGTSLGVYPFAGIASLVRRSIPRLLINRFPVGTFVHDPRENDVIFEGEVVDGVNELIEICGWQKELSSLEEQYKKKAEAEIEE